MISNSLYQILAADQGKYGTKYAKAGSTSTGNFVKAIFLTAGNISTMTATGITGSTDISSATTFAAGSVFAGAIQSIEVKTGAMLLYNRASTGGA